MKLDSKSLMLYKMTTILNVVKNSTHISLKKYQLGLRNHYWMMDYWQMENAESNITEWWKVHISTWATQSMVRISAWQVVRISGLPNSESNITRYSLCPYLQLEKTSESIQCCLQSGCQFFPPKIFHHTSH